MQEHRLSQTLITSLQKHFLCYHSEADAINVTVSKVALTHVSRDCCPLGREGSRGILPVSISSMRVPKLNTSLRTVCSPLMRVSGAWYPSVVAGAGAETRVRMPVLFSCPKRKAKARQLGESGKASNWRCLGPGTSVPSPAHGLRLQLCCPFSCSCFVLSHKGGDKESQESQA